MRYFLHNKKIWQRRARPQVNAVNVIASIISPDAECSVFASRLADRFRSGI